MTRPVNTRLYDALGVEPFASAEQIKRAHRVRSRMHHPDTGDGDREAFDLVQLAYQVLSDPDRRAAYDRTGEARDDADNSTARLVQIIAHAIAAVFDKGEDIASLDLIGGLQKWFAQSRRKADATRAAIEAAITDAESALERLSFGGQGPDLLGGLFRQKIRDARGALSAIDSQLVDFEAARSVVDQYRYRFDVKASTGHATSNFGWNDDGELRRALDEVLAGVVGKGARGPR